MKEPTWVLEEVVNAVHEMLLSEHGGGTGVRSKDLLASALTRPKQQFHYEENSSYFQLAAAYSFGIAKNHPFIDGNKRTAFTIGVLFLEINGYQLNTSEIEATIVFEKLAAGEIDENKLSSWFQQNTLII